MAFNTGNRYLTQPEMEANAIYIWGYLKARGWSKNAVAGMLGNMQTESTINPGIWEGLNEGVGPGYGLVQWTPFTKYTEWCASRGLVASSMDAALQRIEYELENGLQYYPTDNYPLTFAEFKVSTQTPEYLAQAFLLNYERPADSNQPNRSTQARAWYDYLNSGTTPDEPDEPDEPTTPKPFPKSKPLSTLLLVASRRRF